MSLVQRTLYLTPGFLITITREGGVICTKLPIELRRARPPRLALIDAICHGYSGSIDELIAAVAERFGGNRDRLKSLISGLEDAGCLTTTAPAARFAFDPPDKFATPSKGELSLATPVSLLAEGGKYIWHNHKGQLLLRLNLAEVRVATMFSRPISVAEAKYRYFSSKQTDTLNESHFDSLLSRLAGADLLNEANAASNTEKSGPEKAQNQRSLVQAAVDRFVANRDEAAIETNTDRTPVVPVNTVEGTTPAALGLIVAYAMEHDHGRLCEKYNFVPLFLADATRLLERAAKPSIFLFSNYIWNLDENLRLSAAIKAVNPANITIHGGPSTPKYEKDCEDFFVTHTHVDIAVRGEGELTFVKILEAIDPGRLLDLECLKDVAGLSYRSADGIRRSADRERIADVDTIPSPYLMGLFDTFGSNRTGAILETNRGCPYGCTFCDWGSATLSRIRKFDLDRVFRELEWCAQMGIANASIADANFGMLERDVEIAKKIANLKHRYGFPRTVAINYAKNNVKYLRQIIEIFAAGGILTEGVVSLQSMDETTLRIIDRSNIKLDKYNELSTEFRRAKLPLSADIMMGLPGSTPASFASDLQKCTDRDVRVRANPTLLLPNSPMNAPSYRQEHGIVARPGEILQETATYTREQWDDMDQLRQAFYIFDNWGVLRYLGRFVRRETGILEVQFYDGLRSEVSRHPEEWPTIAAALKTLVQYMAPPGSWGLFIEEVKRYVVERLGVADDSALKTALDVQLAHLPAADRSFPDILELEHNYAAWQEAMLTAREDGHRDDWHEHIPQLKEFGPTILTVWDPKAVCRNDVGKPMAAIEFTMRSWEMESPVARPRLGDSDAGLYT